jgi:hypothetical protein
MRLRKSWLFMVFKCFYVTLMLILEIDCDQIAMGLPLNSRRAAVNIAYSYIILVNRGISGEDDSAILMGVKRVWFECNTLRISNKYGSVTALKQ